MRFSFKCKLTAVAFGTAMLSTVSPAFASPVHSHGASVAAASPHSTYVVQSGDTFWKISHRLHVPLNELLKANPGTKPTDLIPGHSIMVPTKAAPTKAVPKSSNTPKKSSHVAEKSSSSSYTKEINAVASAYTAAQGSRDAMGNKVEFGTVAVDPKVIPLGSTLRIEGMSFNGFPSTFIAHATDVGGSIHGNQIDIYLPVSESKAALFGLQHVKVFVLK